MTALLRWVAWLASWGLLQSQTAPVFRVDVDVVLVDVLVGHGERAILGLSAEDFEVYDNGILQTVELLAVETEPLTAILVFDTSESVGGTKLGQLKIAGRAFLEGLESKDWAAVLGFSSDVWLAAEGAGRSAELYQAVETLQALNSTSLYDALYSALKVAQGARRPVVLLFTDGRDTSSWLTDVEVLEGVEQSLAVVYIVATEPQKGGRDARTDLETELLQEVAEASGGRLLYAESPQLEKVFRGILQETKTRYLVSYIPTGVDQDGWHRLEVKVHQPKADVRARRGYWRRSVPGQPPPK